MILKIPHIKKNEQIFFVSYIIFLMFTLLSTSFYYRYFISIYKYIIVFCCILLLFHEVNNLKINKGGFKGLLICFTLFIITYMGSVGTVQNSVAALFLFIYCARKIPFEKIAKVTLIISSVLLAFIILSGYLGIIDNYLYVKSGRSRWCLGFRYILNGPTIYFNIITIWVYLKKNMAKLREIFFLLLVDYWFFFKTNSRMTAFLTAMLLVYSMILKLKKVHNIEKQNRLWLFTVPSYLICAILSIGLTVIYNSSISWMYELNDILSGRLRLAQSSIISNGIHLFSQNLSMVGNGMDAYGNINTESYTYVDCFYVQILIHYGIVFMILYILMMLFVMLQCYKQKNNILLFILLLISIHYIVDDLQLYLYYNTFWFAIGSALMNTGKYRKNKYEHNKVLEDNHYEMG